MQPVVSVPYKQEESALESYYTRNSIASRNGDVSIWKAGSENYQIHQIVVNVGAVASGGLVYSSIMAAGGVLGATVGAVVSTATGLSTGPAAPAVLSPLVTVGIVQGASIGSTLVTPLAMFLGAKTITSVLEVRKITVEELYEGMPAKKYNDVILPLLQKCFSEEDILTCPISAMPIVIPAKTECGHIYELNEIVKFIFVKKNQQRVEFEQKHAGEADLATRVKNITYKPTTCPLCRKNISIDALKVGPEVFKETYRHYKHKFDALRKKIHADGLNKAKKRIQDSRAELSIEIQQLIPGEKEQKVERERKQCVGENLEASGDELIEGMDITELNLKKANNHLYRMRVNDFLKKAGDKGVDPAETLEGIKVLMNEFSLKDV